MHGVDVCETVRGACGWHARRADQTALAPVILVARRGIYTRIF